MSDSRKRTIRSAPRKFETEIPCETGVEVNSNSPDQGGDERAQAGADSLGEQLRRAREARNLTLRELSDQTRISRRHLEAIEANDFKQLPGGIFNRSFIKSFARAVRFNEDEAVRAYQKVARERGETFDDVPTTRQASRIYMDDVPTRSPALTAALSLVILVIISLGVYAGLHYYRRSERPNATTAQNNSPRQNAQNAPGQTTSQPANAATIANAPAAAGLKIVVRAKGEDVWLRSTVDAQSPSDVTLKPEQTKEINADRTLKLEYARVKASALEVTINGRPATVPSETKPGKLVEMLISKDDYERLLQHP
jgi:cytoskeletal protein RodZ